MMTGICAAVGAQLLARGGREPGFVDPERAFDPDQFLAELAGRGTIQVGWRDEHVDATVGGEPPGRGGR
jgi:hypothetical protein